MNAEQLLKEFAPFRGQESVMRLTRLLEARVEAHRDRLEKEESEQTRGRLRELREIIKILSE